MENNITPKGKTSIAEAKKNARDVFVFSVATLVWELLTVVEMTDFWEYQMYVSIILAWLTTFLNRKYNIVRV